MKKWLVLCMCLSVVCLLCACGSADTATTPISVSIASPTSQATASPAGGAKIYSGYAHMVSYDPALGFADFDSFEMLSGDDAVQWLVNEEGYTLSDAQAEVADYADSEFIENNADPQILTIDLRDIPIGLMCHADGTAVEGAEPIWGDLTDLYALYEHDHHLVTDAYFYFITAEDGAVVSVEQVYWP